MNGVSMSYVSKHAELAKERRRWRRSSRRRWTFSAAAVIMIDEPHGYRHSRCSTCNPFGCLHGSSTTNPHLESVQHQILSTGSMTVTFKKAGEAVATRVIRTAKGNAATAAASIQPTREVKPPRAVSKEEAPHMIPAKESTKTTMMPWKGWVDRFMKEKLSPEQYSTIKNTFYFWPEDPYNLMQMPPGGIKVPFSADGQEAGFRDVSPGSQPAVDIPLHALDDDPYDSGYFKKDTRRRFVDPEFPNPEIEQLKLDMQDPNDPEVQAAKEKLTAGPKSSPGNGLRFATGPSDFDPTGLRAVMAVTNAEIQKEMDKHMPDHLPEPTWRQDETELFAWYKDRGLPVPIGGNWTFVRKEKRVARW